VIVILWPVWLTREREREKEREIYLPTRTIKCNNYSNVIPQHSEGGSVIADLSPLSFPMADSAGTTLTCNNAGSRIHNPPTDEGFWGRGIRHMEGRTVQVSKRGGFGGRRVEGDMGKGGG
jgi:hypothetical protein